MHDKDMLTLVSAPSGNGSTYTQKKMAMAVYTPLGEDALLLTALSGQEIVSQLFTFELKLLAPKDNPVDFDQLLGASITVELELPGSLSTREKKRYFNGICNSLTQVGEDLVFLEYHMRLVPSLWLLTKRACSRVFQHKCVKTILEDVLAGLNVDLSRVKGLNDERDYCVQYQETDFNFASRLMEEEGILYYFEHADNEHKMVLVNTQEYTPMPSDSGVLVARELPSSLVGRDYVSAWSKTQEVRAGRYVLRDHCFEKTGAPGEFQSLEVRQPTVPESVDVDGQVHSLAPNVQMAKGKSPDLEIYQYPGEFAQRFDGVDKNGQDRPSDLAKLAADGQRTVEVRMAQEMAPSILIRGAGFCRQFEPGHSFTKEILVDGIEQDAGEFLLTSTSHAAVQGGYRSGERGGFQYFNNFTATPKGLPYVPPRRASKPVIQSTQTAVVVGMSPADDIFTDKYGRVKVQFHWDRDGKFNADSSCWVRVATPLAGQGWGMIHIPRVGQEVIVGFEEGDPDRPIILGCVYNAAMMPPYKPLPDKRTQSGYKSRSTTQGTEKEFNELRFDDKKGEEKIYLHAQKVLEKEVQETYQLKVGPKSEHGPSGLTLGKTDGEQKLEAVVGPAHDYGPVSLLMEQTLLEQKMVQQIAPKHDFGAASLTFDQTKLEQSIELKTGPGGAFGPASIKFDKTPMEQFIELKLGQCSIKLDQKPAMESIEIKVGGNSIKLDQMGITIKGLIVKIEGDTQTALKGLITQLSADALMQVKGAVTMIG